jgi:hypothetical protein
MFSPLGELSMVSFIRINFIEPCLIFPDSDFREVAIDAFLQSHTASDEAPPPFQGSPGFVTSLKTRHCLCSRKIHYRRLPAVTDEQRPDWLARICAVIETLSPLRVINRDETAWLLRPKGTLTQAELGCQVAQAKINGNK